MNMVLNEFCLRLKSVTFRQVAEVLMFLKSHVILASLAGWKQYWLVNKLKHEKEALSYIVGRSRETVVLY